MQIFRGKKLIKQILTDHWDSFANEHADRIRPAIYKNVAKVLRCGTEDMGFHVYHCPECGVEKKVPHTCKSRFCSSCGVKQTDMWIEQYTILFANCQYQHVIFSPPAEFRIYFRVGRKPYFNALYQAVNQTLRDWYSRKGYLPGGMDVSHTFGRDLKFHTHIHMLITCGGLDTTQTLWTSCNYLPHAYLKARFKKYFLEYIQALWNKNNAKIAAIPQPLRVLFTPAYQQKLLQEVTEKTWYVHIGERLSSAKFVVRYIGRYTKRPAIAESRIIGYDGKTVTFTYKEHRMSEQATVTMPVFDFIQRLIWHIPDDNFRVIRYFGFYANRVRGTVLPKVFTILKQDYEATKGKLIRIGSWWRQRIERFMKLDPLMCSVCFVPLQLVSVVYATNKGDPYG